MAEERRHRLAAGAGPNTARDTAQRGAIRHGRMADSACAVRHDHRRRGPGTRDRARGERLSCPRAAPFQPDRPRHPRRAQGVVIAGGGLHAEWSAARGGRTLCAARPRTHLGKAGRSRLGGANARGRNRGRLRPILSRRHRPDDGRFLRLPGRLVVDGGPRRVRGRDRAGLFDHLPGRDGLCLRAVVPGPDRAANAQHSRGLRPGRHGIRRRRPFPRHPGSSESCLFRP